MIITAFSTHCFSECYDLFACFSHCDDVSYPNVGNFLSEMCPEYIPPTVACPALLALFLCLSQFMVLHIFTIYHLHFHKAPWLLSAAHQD